jgi:ribosome maturation factor RimP
MKRRERGPFPSSFGGNMNSTETLVQAIGQMVKEHIPEESPYFLVEIRIKPTNNVKIFVDGDQGITIERCAALNKALYKQLDGSGLFPNDDFSLEVSSPGLDEPLKSYRQYVKNIGRPVEVLLKDGLKTEGILKTVDEAGITVEESRGKNPHPKQPEKKKEVLMHSFSFDNIKSTKVQIKF